MRKVPDQQLPPEQVALGFARAAAFFATVTVVGILALLGSAQAATAPAPAAALAVAPLSWDEGEAEEWEAEEPEEAEEDLCLEEWDPEICVEEPEPAADPAPAREECLLLGATATVRATLDPGRVGLTVRYRASSPTVVTVSYELRGAKGALKLGKQRQRFRRAGVFRDTAVLGGRGIAKLAAAREFAVSLRPVNSPGRCRVDRHLTERRAVAGGAFWSEPSARKSGR